MKLLEWYTLACGIYCFILAVGANYVSVRDIVYTSDEGWLSTVNARDATFSNAEVTMLLFMSAVCASQFALLRTQSDLVVKRVAPFYFYLFTFFAVLQLSYNSSIFDAIRNMTSNTTPVPIVTTLKGFEWTLPAYILQNVIMQVLYYNGSA